MACVLRLECYFLCWYFQCLLPDKTIDVEVKVTSVRRIHTFRRDRTTQIITCKLWSPKLHPYQSLAWRMQTYLELKDPEVGHPCLRPNQPDKSNAPSIQKAPVPKRPANKKKRRNRSKQANRKQFKGRLIEKPLFPSNRATTMTVTQSTRTDPIMTSVMWPTTKTTKVPLTIYSVPSVRILETPDSPRPKPRPKPQGRERTPIPVHKILPMEQHPATLIPKSIASATPAILPMMSMPSRDPIPWPNAVPASANLFITRSWPLPSNNGDSLIPTMQKMIKSDPSQTENTPSNTTIPHPVSLILENYSAASGPATTNNVVTSRSQEEKWGPCCQYHAQYA